MATKIEWTDETWNPITGCTKVSEGCRNCYAERMAKRLAGRYGYPADEPFRVTAHHNRLDQPARWKRPRKIFVCSMGDLFHENISGPEIAGIFGLMASTAARVHTFMILTKRAENLREWFKWLGEKIPGRLCADHADELLILAGHPADSLARVTLNPWAEWPLPNVWLGVSVEDQKTADERIPLLLQTPAAKRFVSCEPLLDRVDLQHELSVVYTDTERGNRWVQLLDDEREEPILDWVIVGGESGPGARPMHPDWARSIRDQCQAAGVPFFFKQWGGGKKQAGAELDGRTWEEWPE